MHGGTFLALYQENYLVFLLNFISHIAHNVICMFYIAQIVLYIYNMQYIWLKWMNNAEEGKAF